MRYPKAMKAPGANTTPNIPYYSGMMVKSKILPVPKNSRTAPSKVRAMVKPSHILVSYTHLDVYKRPVVASVEPESSPPNTPAIHMASSLLQIIRSRSFNLRSTSSSVTNGVPSVSYTHLDVYKRQFHNYQHFPKVACW